MARHLGILALQGDFAKHAAMLKQLDVAYSLIKKPSDLAPCDGLIIPGGESTTMTILMHKYELYPAVTEFAQNYPVMGTCAGMIMVANQVDDERVDPLHLINIKVLRNAYGRQIDSFTTMIELPFLDDPSPFQAVFIRAPQIETTGEGVMILLHWQDQPIMVRNETVLALAFHPELTRDPRIHRYFLENF
ncbi:MAG: pyridoxal 5'-phosphate synthase glutaminase subunit PdxT [Gemmatimonadetes bacterium]|nr:MAG: pyridoxal 5'-phosphate synthase glutaminase subunit PdxT [Gemmatimonadota bacterium]